MKTCAIKKSSILFICLIILLYSALFITPVRAITPGEGASESLSSLSTSELISTILAEDYSYQLTAVSLGNVAYECLVLQYDIFSELESRPDAATQLLSRLDHISSTATTTSHENRSQYNLLVTMLSQDTYSSQLSPGDLITLKQILYPIETPISPNSTTSAPLYNSDYDITYTHALTLPIPKGVWMRAS